jgi:hypothetical protein
MEMIFVLVSILQSVAISLGVGCSTVAIVNFFVALADGKIDEQERKMMGVVYTLLRIAMVLILITTAVLGAFMFTSSSSLYLSPFIYGVWTLVGVLFLNAILMTKRIMPSNIGPALQASTWYTLGVLMALVPLGLTRFSYFEFIVGYAAAIALGLTIVNGVMSHLKYKKK